MAGEGWGAQAAQPENQYPRFPWSVPLGAEPMIILFSLWHRHAGASLEAVTFDSLSCVSVPGLRALGRNMRVSWGWG